MPRTLTSPQTAASVRQIVAPIWFLQIAFSTPLRLTSGPTIPWNGFTWTEAKMDVRGIKWDGSIAQSVTIDLADPTQAYGALCATQKLTDRAVRLWLTDRTATATADPIGMPPLVGNNWSTPKEYQCQITATVTSNKQLPSGQLDVILPPEITMPGDFVLHWGTGTINITKRPETRY